MTEWCWAAVSVSVDQFFRPGSTQTQCEIAGSALSKDCCSGKSTAPCNVPHELNPVLATLRLLAGEPIVKPLDFADVQKQIDAGRPVCVLIKWLDDQGQPTNRGHFNVISGYKLTQGQKPFVSIADPLFGPSMVAYEEFSNPKGGYRDGRGVWFASFLVKDGGETGAAS